MPELEQVLVVLPGAGEVSGNAVVDLRNQLVLVVLPGRAAVQTVGNLLP